MFRDDLLTGSHPFFNVDNSLPNVFFKTEPPPGQPNPHRANYLNGIIPILSLTEGIASIFLGEGARNSKAFLFCLKIGANLRLPRGSEGE